MYIKIGNQVFDRGSNFEGTIEQLAEIKRIELGAESYELIDPENYMADQRFNDRILSEIRLLESAVTTRRLLDAVATQEGKEWVEQKRAEIAAKRALLRQ